MLLPGDATISGTFRLVFLLTSFSVVGSRNFALSCGRLGTRQGPRTHSLHLSPTRNSPSSSFSS